eukprot:5519461-Pleurochrysis_carterae.AAC.1
MGSKNELLQNVNMRGEATKSTMRRVKWCGRHTYLQLSTNRHDEDRQGSGRFLPGGGGLTRR